MSKSKPDPESRVSLEYIGPDGRRYRDLPTLKKGDKIEVTPKMAKALVATGNFQVAKTEAGKKSSAVPQDKGVNDNEQ